MKEHKQKNHARDGVNFMVNDTNRFQTIKLCDSIKKFGCEL